MSEKIRSLIYRELVITKKFYVTNFFAYLLFSVLLCLTRFSYEFGNLAKFAEANPEMGVVLDELLHMMAVYFVPLVLGTVIGSNDIGTSDIKAKWKTYSFALPIETSDRLMARMIIKLTLVALVLVISLLNGIIFCAVSGRSLGANDVCFMILIIDFWLFMDTFSAYFHLRANNEKEASASSILSFIFAMIPMLAAVLVCIVKVGKNVEKMLEGADKAQIDDNMALIAAISAIQELGSSLVEILRYAAVPALLALIAANAFLSYRAMQRREK